MSAAPNDFYLSLLRRGISEFDAARYEPSVSALRLAAFGLVDSVEQYETAYVYLTLANERLGRRDEAHDAAHHVVAADRVEHRFATLALPQTVRAAFDELATKLLSAADIAALKSTTSAKVETRTIPAPEIQPPKVTRTTTTTTTAPPKPEPKKTEPPKTATQTQTPPSKPAPAKPAPVIAPPAQTSSSIDVPARLSAANRALVAGQLLEARRTYRELLEVRALSRDTLLRVAEGLYRSRDFAGALLAFDKLGTLRAGEEPYHYYIAVANFETGRFDAAKRELDAALPYIEITPDVASYRAKIDGAVD